MKGQIPGCLTKDL